MLKITVSCYSLTFARSKSWMLLTEDKLDGTADGPYKLQTEACMTGVSDKVNNLR